MPALLDMASEAFRRAKMFAEDPATGAMDTGMGLMDILGRPGNAVRTAAVQVGRDFNNQGLPQAAVDLVDLLNPQTLPQYMARHPAVVEAGGKGLTGEIQTDATELPGMSNLPDEGVNVGPVHLTPRTVAAFAAGSAMDPLTYVGPGMASRLGKPAVMGVQGLMHGMGGLQGAELVGRDPDTGEVDPGRALAGFAAGLAVPHVPGLVGRGVRGLGSEPVRTFASNESGSLNIDKMGAGAQRLREAALKRKMAQVVGNPETPEPAVRREAPPSVETPAGPQDPGPDPFAGRTYESMSRAETEQADKWAHDKRVYDESQAAPEEAATPAPTTGKTYAGVGSRDTPPEIQSLMTRIAAKLNQQGYTLRSGGAPGADSAFEAGAGGNHEVYLPWRGFEGRSGAGYIDTPTSEAEALAQEHHPEWGALSQGGRKLQARNSHQVLGQDLKSPANFVLAWTPDAVDGSADKPTSRSTGGTGQAIRLAAANGVQVFNLADPEVRARMERFVADQPEATPATPVAEPAKVQGRVQGPNSFTEAGAEGFPAGDQPIVLRDGTVIGRGYSRVIHGGRGDYVELAPDQIDRSVLTSKYGKPDEPLPARAYYRWMEAGPNKTKVYEQAKGVGYADYKPGHYYVDPAELQGFDYPGGPAGEAAQSVAPVVDDGAPAKFRANMHFPFNGQARPEVKSLNTFDAIKAGERTATTRFDAWQGTERWAKAKPGDIVEFSSPKGEKIRVRIREVNRVDLGNATPQQLEDWSKAEGWSVEHARSYSNREDAGHKQGYQIHFDYLPSKTESAAGPTPGDLARKRAFELKNSMASVLDLPTVEERPRKTEGRAPENFPEPYDWADPSLATGSSAPPRVKPVDPRPSSQVSDLEPGVGIEATKRDAFARAERAGLEVNTPVEIDPETGEIVSMPENRRDLPASEREDVPVRRSSDKLSPHAEATTQQARVVYPGDGGEGPPLIDPLGPVLGEQSDAAGIAEQLATVGKARTNETRVPDPATLEGTRYRAANIARAQQFLDEELARVGGDATKSRWYTDHLDNMAQGATTKRDPRTGEPIEGSTPHAALYKRAEAGEDLEGGFTTRVKRPDNVGEPGWQETPEGKAYLRGWALDILTRSGGELGGKSERQVADILVRRQALEMANKANADNPAAANDKRRPKANKSEASARDDELSGYAADDAYTHSQEASDADLASLDANFRGDAHEKDLDKPGYAGSGDVSTQDYGGRNYSQAPEPLDESASADQREHRQLTEQIARDQDYLDSLGDTSKEHGYLKDVYDKQGNPVVDKEGRRVKSKKTFDADELAKQIEVARTRIERAQKRLKTLEPAPPVEYDKEGNVVREMPPPRKLKPRTSNETGEPISPKFITGSETVAPELAAERGERGLTSNVAPIQERTAEIAKGTKDFSGFDTKRLKKFVDDYIASITEPSDQLHWQSPRTGPTLEDRYGRADYAEPNPLIRLMQEQRGAGRQGSAAPPVPNLQLMQLLRSIGLAA